ncbi:MAG: PEP-CTERM sorting domain-containing protein [Methylovulum sp.]|nr:PEP-CTERM sorting domain-containing protein [Methylovulum sp.]
MGFKTVSTECALPRHNFHISNQLFIFIYLMGKPLLLKGNLIKILIVTYNLESAISGAKPPFANFSILKPTSNDLDLFRTYKMIRILFCVIALFAQSVSATPITTTVTGAISGTLGSLSFVDAATTFTFTGDTNDFQSISYDAGDAIVDLNSITGSMAGNIDGIGLFSFSDLFVVISVDLSGILDAPFSTIVALLANGGGSLAIFSTDQLFNILNNGSLSLALYGSSTSGPFGTDRGDLTISDASALSSLTNQIDTSETPLPEPETWLLMALGLGCLATTKRANPPAFSRWVLS